MQIVEFDDEYKQMWKKRFPNSPIEPLNWAIWHGGDVYEFYPTYEEAVKNLGAWKPVTTEQLEMILCKDCNDTFFINDDYEADEVYCPYCRTIVLYMK